MIPHGVLLQLHSSWKTASTVSPSKIFIRDNESICPFRMPINVIRCLFHNFLYFLSPALFLPLTD
jgi:hypothetical protein